MRRRSPLAGSCLFAFVLLFELARPAPAAAQRVIHRVRFGETFAEIARYYFDKTDVGPLIALVNGRSAQEPLRAGERLRVPTAWVHAVTRAVPVRQLARRLLGDPRREFALRQFNRLRGKRVARGGRVLVPFVLMHLSRRGESFVELAERFYGTRSAANLIARYNFIDSAEPPPGTQLAIPIAHIKITPARLTQLTNEQVLGVAPSADQRREGVQEANALVRRGEYWQVPLRLIRMLAQENSSDSYIADVFKLMAIAYVALDRHDLAVQAFREALLREPSMKLDAVRDSPKVIRAFLDASSDPEMKPSP